MSEQTRRLVIEAYALNGRWSVASAERRDRVSWPPTPDTLFSAMVASAAGQGQARDDALLWLEQRDPPAIEYERFAGRTDQIITYAPVADITMFEKGSRKERLHASVGSTAPVRWSWALEPEEPVPLEGLARITAGISYIGSSRGPVLARAFVANISLPGDALVPAQGGTQRLRAPHPGRLDALETDYTAGRRPRPAPGVKYALLEDTIQGPGQTRMLATQDKALWTEPFILALRSGPTIHLDATVPLMETVRRALLSHLGDDAPPVLTGHGLGGVEAPHLAMFPLARAGDTYADGEIMGVGFVLPVETPVSDMDAFALALSRWLGSGGHLSMGRLKWELRVPMASDQGLRTLRLDRYIGPSREWATITPVALPQHPKVLVDGTPKAGRSLPEIVSLACRQAGLPDPTHVEVQPVSSLVGSPPARDHLIGTRNYLKNVHRVHFRIRFKHPVRGPVLLGRGRYFGLGTLIPHAWPELDAEATGP